LTLGRHENFPTQIHRVEGYKTNLTTIKLQEKILRTLQSVNCKDFCFEEVTVPTVPDGLVIFEFGLADGHNFSYLDAARLETTVSGLSKEVQTLDFFCAIRYYKAVGDKKTPLKFDYYLLRTLYGKGALELQVYHERGPRYVTPEDLIEFLFNQINTNQTCKVLKRLASDSI